MATTIKRIYTLALAKIIEAPGTDVDYDSYSPPLLDSLLVEAFRNEFVSALEDAAPAVPDYEEE